MNDGKKVIFVALIKINWAIRSSINIGKTRLSRLARHDRLGNIKRGDFFLAPYVGLAVTTREVTSRHDP